MRLSSCKQNMKFRYPYSVDSRTVMIFFLNLDEVQANVKISYTILVEGRNTKIKKKQITQMKEEVRRNRDRNWRSWKNILINFVVRANGKNNKYKQNSTVQYTHTHTCTKVTILFFYLYLIFFSFWTIYWKQQQQTAREKERQKDWLWWLSISCLYSSIQIWLDLFSVVVVAFNLLFFAISFYLSHRYTSLS